MTSGRDYLAMGYSEEETAEFDAEVTIDGLCDALTGLGFAPDRIGGIKKLTERLAAGERWDGVFNFCEGASRGWRARPRCRRCWKPTTSPMSSPIR